MRLITIVILALACLLPGTPASAHPHVYVDVSLVYVFDDSGLTSVEEHWLFDEMFTQAILSDLELTPQTLATTLGQEKLKQGAFNYLANYDYFNFIETAGKRVKISEAQDFRASVAEGRLVYDFTLPLNMPLGSMSDFRMGVFDKEYYTDMVFAENGISFDIGGMVQVSHSILPAKDQTYWKFIVPKMVHLSVSGGSADAPAPPPAKLEVAEGPGLMTRIMETVRSTQKKLTDRLNDFGMQLRDNPWSNALWLFIGFSFIYGVVHAVGPGHGKSVVCSYFLANPGSLVAGAIMGNTITFVHMGSAAIAVGAAYMIFSSGMGGFAEASRAIQPASYALLALMGIFLVLKALFDLRKNGVIPPAGCDHDLEAQGDNLKSILMVSFVTGLIPCPGAAVILAFSIGLNIFWIGVAALFAMALGMGLTTTLFAWFAVTARSVTLQTSGRHRKLFGFLRAGLSICGAGAIAVFGSLLFYGSISG